MEVPLIERNLEKIQGVISCYDRIVIHGSIPDIGYPDAMSRTLSSRGLRIFDYTKFVEPFRDELRNNAEQIAQANGLEIEFIKKLQTFRKEKRIKEILENRGDHPGIVHIFSAMETCRSFMPWHNKKTHQTYLKSSSSKCVHYYFYFIDELFGLCHLRVPTWAPFRLQFYCNGHHWVASKLTKAGVEFQLQDNAFIAMSDFQKAQQLSDQFPIKALHQRLDQWAQTYCPVISNFHSGYHWSLTQVEYATDIVFKRQSDLKHLYEALVRTAIYTVKPENIATFLGRKLHFNYEGEMGNDFHTRIEGSRIKHHMGAVSIKMYDKFALVLRIETTANDVSFFKHYRPVVHRNGSSEMKLASVKKNIYSLRALQKLMSASNRRYLEFLSEIEDPTIGFDKLEKISKPVQKNQRPFRGFNLFNGDDLELFETIVRGEFLISGFRNSNLRKRLKGKTSSQISRMLKRLHTHGLIKKIGKTYKYYLTKLGQKVILSALKVRRLILIPQLAQ